MKVAIIDDEISEQNILEKYILEWAMQDKLSIEILKFKSSENFMFSWEDDKKYDLLILDIEMGEMNGLELAKKIRLEDEAIPIIFVTGYDEYMQCGYDVAALHYLIKPVDKSKLFMALNKVQEKRIPLEKMLLATDIGVRSISINKMMYVEANGHRSILYLPNEKITFKESFGDFEKKISGHSCFVKCHRAYIVNLKFVSMILKSDVLLDNDEKIPVSRKMLKKVQEEFLRYYKTT